MKKFIKEKSSILILLFVTVASIICLGLLNKSKTSSSYNSQIDLSSSTEIAKWNIQGLSKHENATANMDLGFSKSLDGGSIGNWFLEISNESDVSAKIIASQSKIRFRINHGSYNNESPNNIGWNFLSGENPVHFVISLYEGSYDDIVTGYVQKDNLEGPSISVSEYAALSESEKANYIEVLSDTATSHLLFSTSAASLEFVKDQEIGQDSKLSFFYYCDVTLPEDDMLIMNLNDPDHTFSFVVNWQVDDASSGGTGVGEYSQSYLEYQVFEGAQPDASTGYTLKKKYTISGVEYFLCQREREFFEYQKYLSSLGGEPTFSFPSTLAGKEMLVKYSRLGSEQRNTIQTYSSYGVIPASVEELNHYCEFLTYGVYETFIQHNEELENALPYLSYGLTCSISIQLKAEQID